MLKKALILTWTGVSDEELIFSFYRLKEDNFDVKIMSNVVSVSGDPKPLKGVNGCSFHSDFHVNNLQASINAVLDKTFDLLILPGGVKCIEKLRQDQYAIRFISDWCKQKKVVGSICHGSQLLISAKVVKGRKISGYYSIKDDIINAGGDYVDEPAVVDENIVTTAHYKNQHAWMRAVLDTYYEKNK